MRSREDRFWSKVDKTAGCWLWTAAVDRKGYGAFRDGQRVRKAQQVAYELIIGPIPDGMVLDHLCRVPACVNPDHLEPVTFGENSRRANVIGYFGNATTCKRGHDWTVHPPVLVRRSNGVLSRWCRVCQTERQQRRANVVWAEDNPALAYASGWKVRVEGAEDGAA